MNVTDSRVLTIADEKRAGKYDCSARRWIVNVCATNTDARGGGVFYVYCAKRERELVSCVSHVLERVVGNLLEVVVELVMVGVFGGENEFKCSGT